MQIGFAMLGKMRYFPFSISIHLHQTSILMITLLHRNESSSNDVKNQKQQTFILSRLIRLLLLAVAIQTGPADPAYCQYSSTDTQRPLIGITGGINANMHKASFSRLPDVPSCCDGYNNGSGTGWFLGPHLQLSFSPTWQLGLSLVYSDLSATLKENEDIGPVGTDNGIVEGLVEHRIESSTATIELRPTIRYRLIESFPMTFFTGTSVGIYVRNSYSQTEKMLSPPDYEYKPGGVVRNAYSGDVPSRNSVFLAFHAGIGYEWQASKSIVLAPEIGAQLGVISLTSAVKWLPANIYAGIGVLYRIPEPPPPPPPPPLPEISVALSVRAKTIDGQALDAPRILVQNTVRSELFPMLPYVFFGQELSNLTSSSQTLLAAEQTQSFQSKELPGQTLAFYHNLLNIIGERMRLDPASEIVLTGCNNMQAGEKSNQSLSRKRAEAVRDYLSSVWGISTRRMQIKSRNLPKEAPDPTTMEGQEEARRVEISSSSERILDPNTRVEATQSVSYCVMEFVPTVKTEGEPRSWDLTVSQNGKTLFERKGKGTVPAVFEWPLDSATAPAPGKDVIADIRVGDKEGQFRGARAQFRVEREARTKQLVNREGDRRIDRFNLILFEFNKATLGTENMRIVDLVRQAIQPNSQVTIYGYADRTGDPELNHRLAQERCDAVQSALGKLPEGVNVQLKPIGSDTLLYDNQIPEGRNFCRTVVIVVERIEP
jgi:outer membrane protein OmpA-like peptidoglycan-associated protein